ncbi:MAG: lytic transglycosylase domain-containing protein, partial [Terriglobia bacterium]
MNQPFWPLTCFFTLATLVAFSSDASALSRHKPDHHARKAEAAKQHLHQHKTALKSDKRKRGKRGTHVAAARRKAVPPARIPTQETTTPPLSGDLLAVRQAVDLVRGGKSREAIVAEKAIGDPTAQKLVEWFILRHHDSEATFSRYAAFLADNQDWPSAGLMRRRAEARLWQERSDATTVHNFTRDRPASAMGRFALARVLLAQGNLEDAGRQVREAWRSAELSERNEAEAFELFQHLLTPEDHRARMDKRIGSKDFSGAMRAAHRLGSDDVSIVKACVAVAGNATKALELLDAVATEARPDLGYVLCRIDWMMRHDRIADATRLMLTAPPE